MSTNDATEHAVAGATELAQPARRLVARGQMLVTAALMLSVLLGLVGAGVDYGMLVIERLKSLDHVAFLRFASVYLNPDKVDVLLEELAKARARPAL